MLAAEKLLGLAMNRAPASDNFAKGFLEVCGKAALDWNSGRGIAEGKRRRGEEEAAEGAYLKSRNCYNLYTNGLVK